MRHTVIALTLLSCLGMARAEPQTDKKKTSGPDVNFLNSEESYWVNKGFNDTIYTGNSGSQNSARSERDQFRADQALDAIYKPTEVVQVTVVGRPKPATMPTLKMGGREIDLKNNRNRP